MRRVVILAIFAALFTGCVERPPVVTVVNETAESARGTMRLYYEPSMTGVPERLTDLRATWTFEVPANATAEVARLPRDRVEYHWLVVELEDGRSHALAVHNGDHFSPVFIRVSSASVAIQPQSVR